MTVYRFCVTDPMNGWARALEIEADDPDQARRRAESYMFARRSVGDHDMLVRLTQENQADA